MTANRFSGAAAVDDALRYVKASRQRLAAAIRSAQLELERLPQVPANRHAQVEHERQALAQALAPLLVQPPPVELPKGSPDREIATTLRQMERQTLDAALGLAR
jgi:hypothetical protein